MEHIYVQGSSKQAAVESAPLERPSWGGGSYNPRTLEMKAEGLQGEASLGYIVP